MIWITSYSETEEIQHFPGASDLGEDPTQREKNARERAAQTTVRSCWYSGDAEAMTKAGTFCGALHYRLLRVLQVLISKMLAFFDRNQGLQLFAKFPRQCFQLADFLTSDETSKLHLDLLRAMTVDAQQSSAQSATAMEEVISDSRSTSVPFHAQFPFSYHVANQIEAFKVTIQSRLDYEAPAKCASALAESFAAQGVPVVPDFAGSGMSNLRYLHDFVAMNVAAARHLTRWQQTKLVLALFRRAFGVTDVEAEKIQQAEFSMQRFEQAVQASSNSPVEEQEEDPARTTALFRTNTDTQMMHQEFPMRVDLPQLNFPPSFFEVHVGFWLNRDVISFLINVLDCCPIATPLVLQAVDREAHFDAEEQKAVARRNGDDSEKTCLYSNSDRTLGFSAHLASIVIDHLAQELLTAPEEANYFNLYTDWVKRADSFCRHTADLLANCFRFSVSSPMGGHLQDSLAAPAGSDPTFVQLAKLMQHRIALLRDVKLPKLEIISKCIHKLSLDCNCTTANLAPLLSFVALDTESRCTADALLKEPEAAQTAKKNTFRSIRVVESLLLGYAGFAKANERLFVSGMKGNRAVSSSSSSSAFAPPPRTAGGLDQHQASAFSRSFRKRLGEVLEWLYLDVFLLASSQFGTSAQAQSYLSKHLAVDLFKHLCNHAAGRPCCLRHNCLVAHDTHDSSVIAFVPGPTTASEEVPVSVAFILALLRRLRRLFSNSNVIESEIRALLTRAQTKNKGGCRDTEFATAVSIVEEEMEREKLRAEMASEVATLSEALATKPSVDPTESPLVTGRPLKKQRSEEKGKNGEKESEIKLEDFIGLADLYEEAQTNPEKLLEKLRGVARFRAYVSEYVPQVRQTYLDLEATGGDVPSSGGQPAEGTTGGQPSFANSAIANAQPLSPSSAVGADDTDTKKPAPIIPLATLQKVATVCENELRDSGNKKTTALPVRSARMLALKTWERLGGSTELQNSMAAPPLSDRVAWFSQWRNDPTAQDLNGFLGGSKLPSWNPYHDYNLQLSEYLRAR